MKMINNEPPKVVIEPKWNPDEFHKKKSEEKRKRKMERNLRVVSK